MRRSGSFTSIGSLFTALPSTFSPKKSVEKMLVHHSGESNAGRAAIHLALYVFLGPDIMRKKTAGTLDATKMRQLKEIIPSKFAIKRCAQDRAALWGKCKIAIGQKCKHLRYKHHKSNLQIAFLSHGYLALVPYSIIDSLSLFAVLVIINNKMR